MPPADTFVPTSVFAVAPKNDELSTLLGAVFKCPYFLRFSQKVQTVEIPQGIFAWFADPDGNIIGLWKVKQAQ